MIAGLSAAEAVRGDAPAPRISSPTRRGVQRVARGSKADTDDGAPAAARPGKTVERKRSATQEAGFVAPTAKELEPSPKDQARLVETFAMDAASSAHVGAWIHTLEEFKELSDGDMRRMVQSLVPLKCHAGYHLTIEGRVVGQDDPGDMYFIYAGQCVVTRAWTTEELRELSTAGASKDDSRHREEQDSDSDDDNAPGSVEAPGGSGSGSGTPGTTRKATDLLTGKGKRRRYVVPPTHKFLATLTANKYFGERAPPGRRRNANVVADADTVVFAMSRANQDLFFNTALSEEMESLNKLRRSCTCPARQRSEQDLDRLEEVASGIDFFKAMARPQLRQLCQLMTYESFEKGKRVVEQGLAGSTLYIIISGSVDTMVYDVTGNVDKKALRSKALSLKRAAKLTIAKAENLLDTLSAGDSFGEMALVEREHRRPYSAKTTEFTELMVISAEQYEQVLADGHSMHLRDKMAFARRLRMFTAPDVAATLTPANLTKLCCYFRDIKLSKGAVVLQAGQESPGVFFVVAGLVSVLAKSRSGSSGGGGSALTIDTGVAQMTSSAAYEAGSAYGSKGTKRHGKGASGADKDSKKDADKIETDDYGLGIGPMGPFHKREAAARRRRNRLAEGPNPHAAASARVAENTVSGGGSPAYVEVATVGPGESFGYAPRTYGHSEPMAFTYQTFAPHSLLMYMPWDKFERMTPIELKRRIMEQEEAKAEFRNFRASQLMGALAHPAPKDPMRQVRAILSKAPPRPVRRLARPKSAHATGTPILRLTPHGFAPMSTRDKAASSPLLPPAFSRISTADVHLAYRNLYTAVRTSRRRNTQRRYRREVREQEAEEAAFALSEGAVVDLSGVHMRPVTALSRTVVTGATSASARPEERQLDASPTRPGSGAASTRRAGKTNKDETQLPPSSVQQKILNADSDSDFAASERPSTAPAGARTGAVSVRRPTSRSSLPSGRGLAARESFGSEFGGLGIETTQQSVLRPSTAGSGTSGGVASDADGFGVGPAPSRGVGMDLVWAHEEEFHHPGLTNATVKPTGAKAFATWAGTVQSDVSLARTVGSPEGEMVAVDTLDSDDESDDEVRRLVYGDRRESFMEGRPVPQFELEGDELDDGSARLDGMISHADSEGAARSWSGSVSDGEAARPETVVPGSTVAGTDKGPAIVMPPLPQPNLALYGGVAFGDNGEVAGDGYDDYEGQPVRPEPSSIQKLCEEVHAKLRHKAMAPTTPSWLKHKRVLDREKRGAGRGVAAASSGGSSGLDGSAASGSAVAAAAAAAGMPVDSTAFGRSAESPTAAERRVAHGKAGSNKPSPIPETEAVTVSLTGMSSASAAATAAGSGSIAAVFSKFQQPKTAFTVAQESDPDRTTIDGLQSPSALFHYERSPSRAVAYTTRTPRVTPVPQQLTSPSATKASWPSVAHSANWNPAAPIATPTDANAGGGRYTGLSGSFGIQGAGVVGSAVRRVSVSELAREAKGFENDRADGASRRKQRRASLRRRPSSATRRPGHVLPLMSDPDEALSVVQAQTIAKGPMAPWETSTPSDRRPSLGLSEGGRSPMSKQRGR